MINPAADKWNVCVKYSSIYAFFGCVWKAALVSGLQSHFRFVDLELLELLELLECVGVFVTTPGGSGGF